MFENFDFSSIKNIIMLKFITPVVNVTTIFFARIKDNKLKFRNNKPNVESVFEAKTKDNNVNFKNTAIAKIIVLFSGNPVLLTLKNEVAGRIKLFAKGHENLTFNATSNEHLIVCTFSNIKLKLTAIANAVCKFNITGSDNKMKFKNNIPTALLTLHAKSITDSKLSIIAAGEADLRLHAATFNNKMNFITQASAVVYRPTKLGDLYDLTLEDLCSKTLSELYGIELIW